MSAPPLVTTRVCAHFVSNKLFLCLSLQANFTFVVPLGLHSYHPWVSPWNESRNVSYYTVRYRLWKENKQDLCLGTKMYTDSNTLAQVKRQRARRSVRTLHSWSDDNSHSSTVLKLVRNKCKHWAMWCRQRPNQCQNLVQRQLLIVEYSQIHTYPLWATFTLKW